jgi:hypothetical protein
MKNTFFFNKLILLKKYQEFLKFFLIDLLYQYQEIKVFFLVLVIIQQKYNPNNFKKLNLFTADHISKGKFESI